MKESPVALLDAGKASSKRFDRMLERAKAREDRDRSDVRLAQGEFAAAFKITLR